MTSSIPSIQRPEFLSSEYHPVIHENLFIAADISDGIGARSFRDAIRQNELCRSVVIPNVLNEHFDKSNIESMGESYLRASLNSIKHSDGVLIVNLPERRNKSGLTVATSYMLGAALVSERVKTVYFADSFDRSDIGLAGRIEKLVDLGGKLLRLIEWKHENGYQSYRVGDEVAR